MKIVKTLKNVVLSYVTVLVVLALLPAFLITNDISLIEEMIASLNK
ncbi:hypothetical protein EDD69_10927 [Thermolongibacillus altinsuensis]|uniref:Uncharacterized protein n=1 Tax=Thermolongibacillus altinsuensis TaxID=575256 RepID=A0A4R1QET7_9BACL|nr:hypothetical protein [Thermolongibacillus altinsuensis]TCL48397.1 hypothetical protein EDD69_10927 [Thermolongibacillus altinsuensis]GMB08029.1 hypothetical protein B1no1_07390 [Thermolongibacillus altinsuensis]